MVPARACPGRLLRASVWGREDGGVTIIRSHVVRIDRHDTLAIVLHVAIPGCVVNLLYYPSISTTCDHRSRHLVQSGKRPVHVIAREPSTNLPPSSSSLLLFCSSSPLTVPHPQSGMTFCQPTSASPVVLLTQEPDRHQPT